MFFAVIPYLACSCKLFQLSQAPGLMLNITTGTMPRISVHMTVMLVLITPCNATGGAMFLINLYAIFIDDTLADFPFKLFCTTYCTIGVTFAVFAKMRESLGVRVAIL